MLIQREPWPGNAEGCRRLTLPVAARMIREGSRDVRRIQSRAFQVLIAANNPKTIRSKAQAILDHVRATVVETEDPPGTEILKAAHLTICAADGGGRADGDDCIPGGDCDDGLVAIGSLLGAAGIDNRIAAIDFGPGVQPHVANAFQDERGTWLLADFRAEGPITALSSTRGKVALIDPLDPKLPGATPGGEFIGVGKPFESAKEALDMTPENALTTVDRPAVGTGAIAFVDPGDVLAYRKTWELYVRDSIAEMRVCAKAIDDVLASGKDSAGEPIKPAVAALFSQVAGALREASGQGVSQGTLSKEWDAFAGFTDEQIVAGASYILRGHQRVIVGVNALRNVGINLGCKTGWPKPPGIDVQAQVIGRIEGAGILARGSLGIMAASAVDTVDLVGRQVDNFWSVVKSPWTWVGVSVLAIAVVLIVYYPEIKTAIAAARARASRTTA